MLYQSNHEKYFRQKYLTILLAIIVITLLAVGLSKDIRRKETTARTKNNVSRVVQSGINIREKTGQILTVDAILYKLY